MSYGDRRKVLRIIGTVLLAIYLVGGITFGLDVLFRWLRGVELPRGEWWQFALAPLFVGVVAVLLEAIGEFLSNGFAFRETNSRFRRAAGMATLILLLIGLVIGWPIYRIAHT